MQIRVETFPAEWDPAGGPAAAAIKRPAETPTLGLRLSPLDETTRVSFGIAHTRPGLVVEGIAPYSTAAELGIVRGDLILRVASTVVRSVADFTDALARHRGPRGTLLQVESRGTVKWIVLPGQ